MDKGRAALLALVLQNTLLVLTMRYSRTRPGPMYLASSAVIVDEVSPANRTTNLSIIDPCSAATVEIDGMRCIGLSLTTTGA